MVRNLLTSDRGKLVAFQGLATVGNREEPRDGDVLRDWVWFFAPWARVKDSCPDIDRQVRQVNCGALTGVLGLAPAQNPGTRVGASWSSCYSIHSTRLRRGSRRDLLVGLVPGPQYFSNSLSLLHLYLLVQLCKRLQCSEFDLWRRCARPAQSCACALCICSSCQSALSSRCF